MIAPTHALTTNSLPRASRPHDIANLATEISATDAAALALLAASAGNAPFLARLIRKHPALFFACTTHNYEAQWHSITQHLETLTLATITQREVMRELRIAKEKVALLLALADISRFWPLLTITRYLSEFAALAVQISLRFLLLDAAKRGDITLKNPEAPEESSGIIVLGMGKLGAFELNYSSDIDLIVLFEREQFPYTGARNAQQCMSKIAQDLMLMMQERTEDGYVFRTDLRLRPDPASTPLAVSVSAALTYYETVGQNWERAAMIKARAIAGDIAAGEKFLKELVPYIWRKNLDFATIADIHSIKRQMNATSGKTIAVSGHNIKTGAGGIREIEFFVQTQQLVWGGRNPTLRVRATLDALNGLLEAKLIDEETRDILREHYLYLRTLEHRLQMREDAQTHSLPEDDTALEEVSIFMGFETIEAFEETTLCVLDDVHHIYSESMQDSDPLGVDGNLVFTGVEADAETLATLTRMGYGEAQRISDIVQGWHRGHRKSTKSKRSRQVLTELVPAVLTALAKTANPDAAFFQFDDFLDKLPSGAQIFSLMHSRPDLLTLVADILGSAPALGATLGNNPLLLDAVLESDFFAPLPDMATLSRQLSERLQHIHDSEQAMIYLRVFNNEKRFQAGVHMLKRLANPSQIGLFLSELAQVILQQTLKVTMQAYGRNMHEEKLAVLAFGKLGAAEMTFGSDLDIVFLYDDGGDAASELRTHMQRISQRMINALTLMMREGRLYEVDTRLRPGGSDGPLATNLQAFDAYFASSAWTFEHMALTRARVVASTSAAFEHDVSAVVRAHVLKAHDAKKIHADVFEMRTRIAKEHHTTNPLAIKHVRGGMVDIDFIAQYLVLRYGHAHPEIYQPNTARILEKAGALNLLPLNDALRLRQNYSFLSDALSYQRLCAAGGIMQPDAPIGLKRLLAEVLGASDADGLKDVLAHRQREVMRLYEALEKNTP